MPHCGGAYSCNCVVTGDGVSGSGTLSDPYVITSVPEGGGVTDHGALTGLGEDDHAQYALADGTRGSFAAPLGADDNYVTDAEKAALHAHANKTALDNVSGVNTGDQTLPTWSTISGKPAVVAEGATQADARTAIGAGTSNLAIGTTGTTAAAGNRAATETATGMVELATTAEATTGTDTTRAVTPAGLKAVADTKAPTTHASTHAAAGSDPVTLTSAQIGDLTETVQDIVGAFLVAGTNVTVTYNDAANTFTLNATASGGTTDPEVVRDVIGAAMVAGSGIQITVNDAGDTITVASTAVLPTRQVIAGTGLTGGGDLSANRTLAVSYGTTAGTAAQGNDSRIVGALQPSTAQAINAQTGTTYTLVAGDAGKVVTLSNTGPITLNAPGSVFTAGQRVDVVVINTGMATVVGTSGATANGTPSLVSRARWSAFTILWTSATACVVIGDMA